MERYNNNNNSHQKLYSSSLTRSDSGIGFQGSRSREQDINDWIELIKTQQKGPAVKDKFSFKTKAPLPEIGESSPRIDSFRSQGAEAQKRILGSQSVQGEFSFSNQSDQFNPVSNRLKKDYSSLSNKSMMTRSMDVFPSHAPKKTSRLRPLEPLSVVQELRGASAFHHSPRKGIEFQGHERPSAPEPYHSMNYNAIPTPEPRESVVSRNSCYLNSRQNSLEMNDSFMNDPKINKVYKGNDIENIPPLDLEHLDSVTEIKTGNSSTDDKGYDVRENFSENELSDCSQLAGGNEVPGLDRQNTLIRSNRPKSARKRRSNNMFMKQDALSNTLKDQS